MVGLADNIAVPIPCNIRALVESRSFPAESVKPCIHDCIGSPDRNAVLDPAEINGCLHVFCCCSHSFFFPLFLTAHRVLWDFSNPCCLSTPRAVPCYLLRTVTDSDGLKQTFPRKTLFFKNEKVCIYLSLSVTNGLCTLFKRSLYACRDRFKMTFLLNADI